MTRWIMQFMQPDNRRVSIVLPRRLSKTLLAMTLSVLAIACQETGIPPSSEHTGVNSVSAFLSVDPSEGTAELVYEFETPVREFRFHYRAGRIRDGSWSVLDAGTVLEDDTVRRVDGELMERVRLDVQVDADWFDRVYPAVYPVGDAGLVLNTDFLTLQEIDLDSIRARVAPGNIVAWSNFVSTDESAGDQVQELPTDSWHFVFFGRRELIETFAGGVIVSDAASSSRVLEQLRAGIEPAVAWLGSFLRTESVDRVHVIATVEETDEGTRWRGDVSENAEIFLRFFGDGWNRDNEELERITELVLYHELVHALMSNRFEVGEGEPEWLWEGHAEYLALTYMGRYAITAEPDWFQEEVRQRTTDCINTLEREGVGISHPSVLRGQDPYNCGVLVYWLLDGAPALQGAGDRLRSLWSSVVERLDDTDTDFRVAGLVAAAEAIEAVEAQKLFEILTEGPAGNDWQERDRLLAGLGVNVTYEYGDAWNAHARTAVIDHLLRLHCTAPPIGFWTLEDHLRLDTGERCGPLSGDPLIDRINGLAIFGGMRAVVESVERACSSGESVQLGIFESPEYVTVECTESIRELPPSATLSVGNEI